MKNLDTSVTYALGGLLLGGLAIGVTAWVFDDDAPPPRRMPPRPKPKKKPKRVVLA